ncbi:MAG: cobyric acid synthase [Lachnospiraceae bacterium]|nr:cobyric acid synthase [Lachnospiraceae bacterium]
MIQGKNLSVGYGTDVVIEDFSFHVEAGCITALIGPNGAGKSTLLKTLGGYLAPLSGSILLGGRDALSISPTERAKFMAVMLTSRKPVEYMTCFDVVSVGRYQYTGRMGNLTSKDEEKIEETLAFVGAAHLAKREYDTLSDGQKQRVLLARALVQEPKVLLLDEPTSFLDIGVKLEFVETLKKLAKKEQIAIVVSMHELEFVKQLADYVVGIDSHGTVKYTGKADQILIPSILEDLYEMKPGSFLKLYQDFTKEPVASTHQEFSSHSFPCKFLMVQGTMSSAGKSMVVAALCRIFAQDGYRVRPFKSQNMALNSYITEDGLEMGRAQVLQAEAAGVKPSVYMNPILLKPTSDAGSQVIVNGKVRGNMSARDYFAYKKELVPDILHAVEELSKDADLIVIEGAGSPAEINLKKDDIVNMGMAKLVDAPVLLVGDIDRGGVFAQLLGTLELLEPEEKERVFGLLVNKFRGDASILDPGIAMLEKRSKVPVLGVLPYLHHHLEDEDSLTEKFTNRSRNQISIGVVKLPHISNFTDFDVFSTMEGVGVTYLTNPKEVCSDYDCIILPGSKNTIRDMQWLRESGMEAALLRYHHEEGLMIGICGGYQMLGHSIEDPDGVEEGGSILGLSLLPVKTILASKKVRKQTKGQVEELPENFLLSKCSHSPYTGYEIHMGETTLDATLCEGAECVAFTEQGTGYCTPRVYGTYIHGFFDGGQLSHNLLYALGERKHLAVESLEVRDYAMIKEEELNQLADTFRQYLSMDAIYEKIGLHPRKSS